MRKQRKSLRNGWIDEELAGCEFNDVRLNKRFRKLVEQLSGGIGASIPWACQDWANTKAAYRFLSNPQVNEAEILQGHFQATRERLAGGDAPILMLHDTTEFNYHRDDTAAIGILHKNPVRRKRDGTLQHTIVCGLLMYSSLAGDHRRAASWADRDQILEQGSVLRVQCTQEEDQPDQGTN